jgi:tetratricopeptide (TPR) repeat protein
LTDKTSGIERVTESKQLKEVEIKPGDILHTVSEVGHLQVFNLSMDHFTHRRDELEKTHVNNYWKLREGFPDRNISRLVSEDINLTNELYSVGISEEASNIFKRAIKLASEDKDVGLNVGDYTYYLALAYIQLNPYDQFLQETGLTEEVLKETYRQHRTYPFGEKHLDEKFNYFLFEKLVTEALIRNYEQNSNSEIRFEDIVVEEKDILKYLKQCLFGCRQYHPREAKAHQTLIGLQRKDLEQIQKSSKATEILNLAIEYGARIPSTGSFGGGKDSKDALAYACLDLVPNCLDDIGIKTIDDLKFKYWEGENEGKYRRRYPFGPPWNPWGRAMI